MVLSPFCQQFYNFDQFEIEDFEINEFRTEGSKIEDSETEDSETEDCKTEDYENQKPNSKMNTSHSIFLHITSETSYHTVLLLSQIWLAW